MNKVIEEINSKVLSARTQLVHMGDDTYKSNCGLLNAYISKNELSLYINDTEILRTDLDNMHTMKTIRSTILRRLRSKMKFDKHIAKFLDEFTHGTYTPEYLIKILNSDYFKKNPLKYSSSDFFENGEYCIYVDHKTDGTVLYEINYRNSPVCDITSYSNLLDANALLRRGMIKHCNDKMNHLEKRLNEYNLIKESLLK